MRSIIFILAVGCAVACRAQQTVSAAIQNQSCGAIFVTWSGWAVAGGNEYLSANGTFELPGHGSITVSWDNPNWAWSNPNYPASAYLLNCNGNWYGPPFTVTLGDFCPGGGGGSNTNHPAIYTNYVVVAVAEPVFVRCRRPGGGFTNKLWKIIRSIRVIPQVNQ